MNEKLFLMINSLAGKSHILDLLAISLANGMPYFFILVEIYLYFVAKKKKEAIFAFYSVVMALGISFLISLFYTHNRPFMDNLGVALIQHKPDTSFPSDHTTFLFAIAWSFMFFRVRFWSLFLVLAFLGGITRVYTGVHYPFDILGGMVVGLIGAGIIYICREKLEKLNEFIFIIENKIKIKYLKAIKWLKRI